MNTAVSIPSFIHITIPSTSITNYNRIIGSQLGPNSDSWYLETAYRFNRRLRFNISYQYRRHGKGSIGTPHTPEDGTEKKFLDGTLETNSALSGGFEYEVIRDMYISFNFTYLDAANAGLEQSNDYRNSMIDFSLYINY